jgi:N-methylhydantoinase A
LVAFGGAGPAHASELAAELRIPTVIVPPTPGAHSALGLLLTDIRLTFSRTILRRTASLDVEALNQAFDEMSEEARGQLAREGVPPERAHLVGSIDVRYVGQGYDLSVGLPNTEINRQTLVLIEQAYHDLHRRSYGFAKPDEPTEVVTLRLLALGGLDKPELPGASEGTADPTGAMKGTRPVYFGGTWLETTLYARSQLKTGMIIHGPAIVEQRDSTTVIWPGQSIRVDPWANLVITGTARN